MSVIFENEDERGNSRRTDAIGPLICIGRVSRHMEGKNAMEELETGEMEYKTVEEFLTALKKKFGRGEEKLVNATELKKLEQEGRTMKEFMQEFKKVARGSGYEGRPLIEEFKRG